MFIDPVHDEIFVAINGGSILVFARTASGAASPVRTISGGNTGFNQGPIDVALDNTLDELIVTNTSFDLTFKPTVQVFGRLDNGNVAPVRKIMKGDTDLPGFVSPIGVALDLVNDETFVVSSANDSVRVFGRTATENAAPVRPALAGGNTLLNGPRFLVVTSSPSATLDIDDNGMVEALTDGLLVLRRLFGFTVGALTNGAVAANCARCDAGDIATYVDGLGSVLDIDHDFEIAALTDGAARGRFLFSFTGTALTNGAVGVGCTDRCNAATILPYLQTLD